MLINAAWIFIFAPASTCGCIKFLNCHLKLYVCSLTHETSLLAGAQTSVIASNSLALLSAANDANLTHMPLVECQNYQNYSLLNAQGKVIKESTENLLTDVLATVGFE